ncbi:MAG: hypothetical protein WC969_08240 [Elusimicrobiota bacterium]|jgi:hypothetical protein
MKRLLLAAALLSLPFRSAAADPAQEKRYAGIPAPTATEPAAAAPAQGASSSYSSDNVFVGRYGEVITYEGGCVIEAEMRGPVEVVRSYSRRVYHPETKTFTVQFPKPEDFTPEKFAPMELVQLLVIPKDVPGGLKDLASMRRAKEDELSRAGLTYALKDAQSFEFPPGSFEVRVSSPYRLVQTYTESKEHFFILTGGGVYGDTNYGRINTSLSKHVLLSIPRPLLKKSTLKEALSDTSLMGWGGWLLVMVPACLLALLSKLSRQGHVLRLSYIGRSVLVAVNLGVLYGVVTQTVLLGLKFSMNGDIIAFLPGLIVPWLFPWIAALVGGRYTSRLWKYLLIVFVWYVLFEMIRVPFKPLSADSEIRMAFGISGLVGILHGVCFGLGYQAAQEERHEGSC